MNLQRINKHANVKLLLLALAFLFSTTAHSQDFLEGTHYTIIKTKQPQKPHQVVEYFSFSCPGCYAIEPHIKALKSQQPKLKIHRVHVPYGGHKAKWSQKAFVLMTLLDGNEFKDDIFRRIHQQKNAFDSEQELIAYFASLGFDRPKVEQTLNSFSANRKLNKMNKETRQNRIASIPTLVINGKYQVNTEAIYYGTDLSKLVQYLLSLPSAND